jgi:chromosome segregation ATPase
LTEKTIGELKAQLEQANTEIAKLKTEQSTFLVNKGLPEDTSKIIELQIDKKSLQSKLEKLQRENEELELENNELIAGKATFKNAQASKAVPDEGLRKIDELQATIDKLSTSNNHLEAKVQDVEAKKAKLDEDFEQWQALAKVSDQSVPN